MDDALENLRLQVGIVQDQIGASDILGISQQDLQALLDKKAELEREIQGLLQRQQAGTRPPPLPRQQPARAPARQPEQQMPAMRAAVPADQHATCAHGRQPIPGVRNEVDACRRLAPYRGEPLTFLGTQPGNTRRQQGRANSTCCYSACPASRMPRQPDQPGGQPKCPTLSNPDGSAVELQFGVRRIEGVPDPKDNNRKRTFYEPCCFTAEELKNRDDVYHFDSQQEWDRERQRVRNNIANNSYADTHFLGWNTEWSDLYKFAGRGRNRHGAGQRFNKLYVEPRPAAAPAGAP